MNRSDLQDAAGLDVSRETYERLDAFAADFDVWAARINLVAPSTREELWQRHIVDSLQLLSLRPRTQRWVDIGSGGGFPGMIIAIALSDVADSRVTLVESNRKKCSFLQVAKSKYAPSTVILPTRIEDAIHQTPQPEVVTARALAELNLLLQMTRPWLASGTVGFFLKGRGYEGEIEKSRANWDFDLVLYESRTASDAAVLEVSKLGVMS